MEYKRNLQNNYLVIRVEEESEEIYSLHMAENNKIPGLLPIYSTRMDGELYIQYEITSKQPLDQIYGKKLMSGELLNRILMEIFELVETIQEYLLNPAYVVFDPQYIYVCAENRALQFCYLPERKPENTVQKLAEFFLKNLDHEDFQAVETGYLFYQCVQEDNFSLKKSLKDILYRDKRNSVFYEEMDSMRKRTKEREDINSEKRMRIEAGRNEEKTDKGDSVYEKVNSDYRKKGPVREFEAGKSDREEENCDEKSEVYKVTHRERKTEKKERKIDKVFRMIHPAVLISTLFLIAAIEILYYFQWISLTESGGMFFLVISVEMMGNKLWKRRMEKKEEQDYRWISEEEDAMYRMLQGEMYEKSIFEEKDKREVPERGTDRREYSETEETRYLGEAEQISELHLIPVNGKRSYQEIVVGSEPVLIGKRKGESDVILDSPTVSRTHALLERTEGVYYVCDLNSKNGTFCNGERLLPQEKRRIEEKDLLSFAELEYRAFFYSISNPA